jgi:hypothetical protein
MEIAAQRHQRAVGERHRSRQAVEALAHPFEIAVDEVPGFAEIALHGKGDDDGAPCAAYAQCQTAGARVTANLDLAAELLDTGTLQYSLLNRSREPHDRPSCGSRTAWLDMPPKPSCNTLVTVRVPHT